MTSKIRVGVRIRPVKPNSGPTPVSLSKETNAITIADSTTGRCIAQYPYDTVFGQAEDTSSVYSALARDIVINAVKGFNGTIFAYGQTASGKTHTMIGDSAHPGIFRQALADIFDSIEKTPDRVFLLRLSILDIYNEQLTDLLEPNSRKLHVREDPSGNVFVDNLSEEICTSPEDIVRLLNDGLARRHVGATNMNEYSSRSHSICRLIIESRPKEEEGVVNVSQLNFVDLAGSERVSHTGATGERLKEGQAINKSLFLLTMVITKLSEGGSFINFRDSKLTRILQNALGGNSLTAIVCTINPVLMFLEQTLSTLKFASNARNIATKATINENVTNEAMMKRMQQEIAELRAKIAEFESEDQRAEFKKELLEKEQLFRGAICFSTLGSFGTEKPAKKFRRLTWAPRDRCNFSLTIHDDDLTTGRGNYPGSAIKRDLESVLGRSQDNNTSNESSKVENFAIKRSRRREVIFHLPSEKLIEEGDENEYSSDDDEKRNNKASTDMLVDLSEPVERRSAATSPIAFNFKEDKSVQIDDSENDELLSLGRQIFLENSTVHFEAREEIIDLKCEVDRLRTENEVLKDKLKEEAVKTPQPQVVKPTSPPKQCDKCRNLEDEVALLTARQASLQQKYNQVVAALDEERGTKSESVNGAEEINSAKQRVAELESLLKTQSDKVTELESQLIFNSAVTTDAETQLREMQASVGRIEAEKSCLTSENEALKKSLAKMEAESVTLKENLLEIQRQRDEFDANLQRSRAENEDLVGQMESVQLEMKAKLDELKSKFEASESEKENLLGEKSNLLEKCGRLESETCDLGGKLENAQEEFETKLKSLSEEMSVKIKELEDSQASVQKDAKEKSEKVAELSSANEGLSQLVDELRNDSEVLKTVSSEFESALKEKEVSLSDLEESKKQLESRLREDIDHLEEERKTMQDRINELLQSESALLATISSSGDEKAEEVAKLEQSRIEIAAQLEAVKADLERAKSEVSVLTEKLKEAETQKGALNVEKMGEIKELEESKSVISRELESIKVELEANRSKLESEVAGLNEKLNEAETQKDALNVKKSAEITELEEAKEKLSMELESVKAELEANRSKLESEVAGLTEKLNEAETEKDALNAEKMGEIKELEEAKSVISMELESIKVELEANRSKLESEVAGLTEKLSEAETQTDALNVKKSAEIAELEEAKDKLSMELESVKAELEANRSQFECLESEKDAKLKLESQISDLKAKLEEMTVSVETAESTQEVDERCHSHESEIESLKAKICELESLPGQGDSTSECELESLKKNLADKSEELGILQQEIDSMFEENQDLKKKYKHLEEDLIVKGDVVIEKTHLIEKLEADVSSLRKQISDIEQERKICRKELDEAGEEAASTKVELEKLKSLIAIQTSEAACNTSFASNHLQCKTPTYGVSPPRKSRLSAVLPAFSQELSNDAVAVETSPALTSPFSVSTIQDTPYKPMLSVEKSEMGCQTEEEDASAIIRRIQTSSEFRERFMLKDDYNEAMASYQQTVTLWDQMRAKLTNENERLREKSDRLSDAIGRVVDGGQLSPLPTPQNSTSVVEKTTLTAVGGDTTLSVSTSEDGVDTLLSRLRIFLKEKEDKARMGFSNERDAWSETVKEFEEDIVRLNVKIEKLEGQISAKDEECKTLGQKVTSLENEISSNRHKLDEAVANLEAKNEFLRTKEAELVDVKRSLEDRQTEIKRLQTELALTTASLVVADQGHKTSEQGFAALQEQILQEKSARSSAEAVVSDLQAKLNLARSEADSWRERANLHEDEETRLHNEVTRVHALFEAAEDQVRSLNQKNGHLLKSIQELETAMENANQDRENVLSKFEELESSKLQVVKELQVAQQELTKQQLMVESLTKSVDAGEEKIEKARTLFNRMRDEKAELFARYEQLKDDKKKLVEINSKMKDERTTLRNLVRESTEKIQVAEARLDEIRQERELCEQAVKASREEIRSMRSEQDMLHRDLSQRLLDLGKAWRQCLINAGMPVSEATESDARQLVQEVKWTSKHSLAKLNVLHALQGLGITCQWLSEESYNRISDLESSRRTMLARECAASKVADECREAAVKLRKALAGCRCRTNEQHAQLMKIDQQVLKALNRKPLPTAHSEDVPQLAETDKENSKVTCHEFSVSKVEDDYSEMDMEISS